MLVKEYVALCSKCEAPVLVTDAYRTRFYCCIECSDDRVMPWKEGNPCDCCGADTGVPSVDYDNTLAEELGCVLCEPCWEKFKGMDFKEVVKKIAAVWRANGNPAAADRLCNNFNVPRS